MCPRCPAGLALLGELDPSRLRVTLRPGLLLLRSRWPVATIWQTHRSHDADRFARRCATLLRAAKANARWWRGPGWRAEVEALDDGTFTFMSHLQQGATLGGARARPRPTTRWAFDRWLQRALTQQWLQGIEATPDPSAGGPS